MRLRKAIISLRSAVTCTHATNATFINALSRPRPWPCLRLHALVCPCGLCLLVSPVSRWLSVSGLVSIVAFTCVLFGLVFKSLLFVQSWSVIVCFLLFIWNLSFTVHLCLKWALPLHSIVKYGHGVFDYDRSKVIAFSLRWCNLTLICNQ